MITPSVPVHTQSSGTLTSSFRPLRTYVILLLVAAGLSSAREIIHAEPGGLLQTSASTGLVAHWPLDEGAGPIAEDVAGGYTATLSYGATWTAGRLGSGVALDGVQGYVAPPIIDVPGSALTLAAWVRVTSFAGEPDQRIISKSSGPSRQGHYWSLSAVRSGRRYRLAFRLRAGGATDALLASSGELPVNSWFHAAATYDGSTMRLYLDGVEVGRAAKSGTIATNPIGPVDIGRNPDGSNHLGGGVDDVRVYSRALTAVEIGEAMFDSGGTAPDTSAPSVPSNLQASALSSTSVSLRWNASSDDRGVAGYRVKRNGVVIGSVAEATCSDAGLTQSTTYTYRVSAYDAAGNESADSVAATVTTPTPPANRPPTVMLTAPASGATFLAPASFTIAASASDPENRLSDVRFYVGGSLIGTDTTAPYSVAASGVAAGTYALIAVARDADGASTTSAVVNITVRTTTPSPWTVAFTASMDHATAVTSYLLEVFASGANPDTATPLAASDLGKPVPDANQEIRVDRTTFFEALAPGNYQTTVRAIGPAGSGRSSPYAFTR